MTENTEAVPLPVPPLDRINQAMSALCESSRLSNRMRRQLQDVIRRLKWLAEHQRTEAEAADLQRVILALKTATGNRNEAHRAATKGLNILGEIQWDIRHASYRPSGPVQLRLIQGGRAALPSEGPIGKKLKK